jgi:hypothetical protein
LFVETGDLGHEWFRHAIYFSVFLYGYWIGADRGLWEELVRLRRHSLAIMLGLFCSYIVLARVLPDETPESLQALVWVLRSLYIWAALTAILGWGHRLLNRPFRWLPWANEALYPWYVLHQSLIVLCAYWLLPFRLNAWLEASLVLAGTIAGCWALHAFVIRRSTVLRPCFGLKRDVARRRVPAMTGATAGAVADLTTR